MYSRARTARHILKLGLSECILGHDCEAYYGARYGYSILGLGLAVYSRTWRVYSRVRTGRHILWLKLGGVF